MRYGLALPNGGAWAEASTLVELARLAEEAGWDGVFLEDYIVWQGHQDVPTHDPWLLLAAMAMATARVHFGTMLTPLSRRRPWKVTSELATLDHLSHGRAILPVGLGAAGPDHPNSQFNKVGEETDRRVRARLLDESLDILDGLWRGEPFSHDGERYHLRDVTFAPVPVQRTRVPIWVVGA